MLERRIYNYDSEYPHIVDIHHGGSESYVVYDSEYPNDPWQLKVEKPKSLITQVLEGDIPKTP